VAGYSGDAGNAMMTPQTPVWVSNGRKFSTPDSDNDAWASGNCGKKKGWWMGKCTTSCVNMDTDGIWTTGPAVKDVQYSRMLVKLN